MPELPEVEAVVRTLRPLVKGRRIRCIHVFHPIATKPQAASHLARHAQGRQIRNVDRKGKYVLLALDRGLLTMHFKLDGQLLWFANAKELLDRANQSDNGVHIDVALELDKGVLCFADRRHFGRVYYWRSADVCPGLNVLGIDALSSDFTASCLTRLLAASKRFLKGLSTGSIARSRYRQHLLLRILVARSLKPSAPRHVFETAGNAPLA